MLISYLCFSNQYGEAGMLSSLPNAIFQSLFNLHFSFTEVGWLQRHVSILLAFHKIRIPHEKYCKAQQHRVQYSWSPSAPLPIKIDAVASSAEILCST